jgi:L-lactate dehydrogenase complex protein LldG
MNAREAILARVREALTVPGPGPHQRAGELSGHGATTHTAPPPRGSLPVLALEAARPWLPDGGVTPEERLALLADNLGKLKAVFHNVPTIHAAQDLLFSIARERDWKRVAWHAHPLVEPILAGIPCATHRVDSATALAADRATDSIAPKDALEACDAGITGCDALIAQTGSILVSSATCGGRSLSVLPPVHVVVATPEQIVATLADAFDALRERHGNSFPSMLSFITGPSRTGDIERILVLGAHGGEPVQLAHSPKLGVGDHPAPALEVVALPPQGFEV